MASFKDGLFASLIIGLIMYELNGILSKEEEPSTIVNVIKTTSQNPSTESSFEVVSSYLPYVLKADVRQTPSPSDIRNYGENVKKPIPIAATEAAFHLSLNDDNQVNDNQLSNRINLDSLFSEPQILPQKADITSNDLHYVNNKNINWKRVATNLWPLSNYHNHYSSGCATDRCNHNYHNPSYKYGYNWPNCNDMTVATPVSSYNDVHHSNPHPWMMWLANCPALPNAFLIINLGILMYILFGAINMLGHLLPRTTNSAIGPVNGGTNGASVAGLDYAPTTSNTNHNYYKSIELKQLT